MDYISKIRKNKRRFFGFPRAKTKYQQRKESTVMDFLFFQKKVNKINKLNQFKLENIEEFLEWKKEKDRLAEATLSEKKAILLAFFRRNSLFGGV